MRKTLVSLLSLWLAAAAPACAGQDSEETPTAADRESELQPEIATSEPNEKSRPDAIAIDVSMLEREIVCERVRPTGSRISVERCYYTDLEPTDDSGEGQHVRDELERMRRQQFFRQQAVEDARRTAMRERLEAMHQSGSR